MGIILSVFSFYTREGRRVTVAEILLDG